MITMAVMVVIVDQTEASSVSIWRSKGNSDELYEIKSEVYLVTVT